MQNSLRNSLPQGIWRRIRHSRRAPAGHQEMPPYGFRRPALLKPCVIGRPARTGGVRRFAHALIALFYSTMCFYANAVLMSTVLESHAKARRAWSVGSGTKRLIRSTGKVRLGIDQRWCSASKSHGHTQLALSIIRPSFSSGATIRPPKTSYARCTRACRRRS